jgi:hypothetical protein
VSHADALAAAAALQSVLAASEQDDPRWTTRAVVT